MIELGSLGAEQTVGYIKVLLITEYSAIVIHICHVEIQV